VDDEAAAETLADTALPGAAVVAGGAAPGQVVKQVAASLFVASRISFVRNPCMARAAKHGWTWFEIVSSEIRPSRVPKDGSGLALQIEMGYEFTWDVQMIRSKDSRSGFLIFRIEGDTIWPSVISSY
jgi:hypothetical protein